MDEGVDELAGVQRIAKAPPIKPLPTDSETGERRTEEHYGTSSGGRVDRRQNRGGKKQDSR